MRAPEQTSVEAPVGKLRTLFRRLTRYSLYAAILLVVTIAFWMRSAIYNRFARFPRQEAAWKALRAQRQPVSETGPWQEYRGILHAHSHLSHDCEVSFDEILHALKTAGVDFICLSDHCVDGRADFDSQWRGLHEGKLFVPGFEMKEGFMPFGARPGTVLSNQTDSATLARQIVDNGALLFYAHPEEPHDWNRPELTGMEIYNIHSDAKRYSGGWLALLPDVLLNQSRFPEQEFRLIFKRPSDFVQQWDLLNAARHITGIAGNDCHQNTGLRVICTPAGELRIDNTSPKTLTTIKLNWFTSPIARVLFGPLEPNRELFHLQLDPYERMARFVNTHILARELTEPAVLDALRAGRVFIGFDLVADSTGFRWWADGSTGQVVMGESGALSRQTLLHARSPLPCRFTIVQNGRTVYQREGRNLDWAPTAPGKYRLEAELHAGTEWLPWVYVNPIQLQ
jgi:hypothetical protein